MSSEMVMAAFGSNGYRVGQSHHRAKHSDELVAKILDLYSRGFGYKRLSKMFGVPLRTVRSICLGETRGKAACSFRDV